MLKKIGSVFLLFISQIAFAGNNADPICDQVIAMMGQSDQFLLFIQADKTENNEALSKAYTFAYSSIEKIRPKRKKKVLGDLLGGGDHFGPIKVKNYRQYSVVDGETPQNKIPYKANAFQDGDEERVLISLSGVENKGENEWGISRMCLDKKGCDVVQMQRVEMDENSESKTYEPVKLHMNRGDWYFVSMTQLDQIQLSEKDVWGFTYPSTSQLPSIAKCLPPPV